MATNTSQAGQAWHQALKLRKHLLKQLEKLQGDNASGVDISQFEAIESLLEKFRLACVHTIFLDFAYAVKENTEEALWNLHTSINSEYRRIQNRLKHSSHAVERRKVEKSYNNFLRIAQKFYKGYIQRLSARYDVQELKRVAQGIDVEQMDSGDKISPVPAELSAVVLKSCHATLLRLGDLSRYRTQARHKNPGYDTALTHYSLAHHLKPESGFAHHQMGIVHLDQNNHLDVVYHFYRSWAVDSPHPNARSNLEAEFKSLQLPNSSKSRANTSASQDAFSMWFVRLHALFYKGETFPQQAELEGEVMHRLEMACRNEKSVNTLLKMAFVNIAAHNIASTSCAEKKTDTAIRFWHFVLRFNILFVNTFCAAFEAELREAMADADGTTGASAGSSYLTPAVEALLPVLRVYVMWIAARRHELCSAVQTFGSTVSNMMQSLTKVFTSLCAVTYNQESLASCSYLLSEDMEILGFCPLSKDIVPGACRCFCMDDGQVKTYLQDPNSRLEPLQEAMARVLDILRCAYFLAEDDDVPITANVSNSQLTFEYRPESGSQPQSTSASTPVAPDGIANEASPRATLTPSRGSRPPKAKQTSQPASPNGGQMRRQTQQQQNTKNDTGIDDAENTVMNMLSPFLKPPTPQPHKNSRPLEESSYGMHTATANEIFGPLQSEPSPRGSVPSGRFEPLPWAWFNTPKPEKGQDTLAPGGQDGVSARGSPYDSPRDSFPNGSSALDDPFATPGRSYQGAFATSHVPSRGIQESGNPGHAGDAGHRNQLLQAFAGTNVPRSSPFANWAENRKPPGLSNGAPASPWTHHAPNSTATSGFSHPSSLYQGTPANAAAGVGLGLGQPANAPDNPGQTRFAHPGHGNTRNFQMDKTTTNYNEAILQAAYHDKK